MSFTALELLVISAVDAQLFEYKLVRIQLTDLQSVSTDAPVCRCIGSVKAELRTSGIEDASLLGV